MKIFVITSSRADYGLLNPLIKKLVADDFFDARIIVTGTHLSPQYGNTIQEIEEDNLSIFSKINILEEENSQRAMANISARAISEFAKLYETQSPDVILVLGDRYEIFCAVFAALFFKIPVIHYSGGEKTEGAYDDAIRHSITKMSHLHFVSADEYRKRVIQLGERPENVFNVGSLGVDNIVNVKLLTKQEFENSINLKLDKPYFLISYHPETLSELSATNQFTKLLQALDHFKDYQFIFTKSNADEGGALISKMIDGYVQKNSNAVAFESLGLLRYLSAIEYCELVIGNSSSGLTEVPSFNKPTVNIGNRQRGRIQGASIINTEIDSEKIREAIELGMTNNFKKDLKQYISPFGDGTASNQIIAIIKSFNFSKVIMKSFYDIDFK